jgi:hypothetical protein
MFISNFLYIFHHILTNNNQPLNKKRLKEPFLNHCIICPSIYGFGIFNFSQNNKPLKAKLMIIYHYGVSLYKPTNDTVAKQKTEMQNSNKSDVPLLDFVSRYNVG